MGMGTSVSTAVSERTAVVIEDYMFDASTAGELQPEASPSDFHDTWDLDGTDFTPEASPDDEGYWDDFSNIVLNGDYEELGSELVTNGDFATDSDWNMSGGTFQITDGKLHCISDGSYQYAGQGGVFVVGKTYKITFDIVDYTSGSIRVRPSGQSPFNTYNAVGTYTQYFTATNTTLVIERNDACNLFVDNVSVKQVDPNSRWSLGTGWSISDGKARYDASSGSSFTFLGQASLFPGAGDYQVTFTLGDLGGSFAYNHAGIVVNGIVNSFNGFGISSAGTHTVSINLDGSNLNLNFYGHTSGGDFSIDDVQVKEYAITPLDV